MNISKYRIFIQVVESGSLTKAAKALGYSQPGVSHIINTLESEMGFPLLTRSKNRIQLTEEGRSVLYYCYQIVKSENELQETVSAINGLMEGDIRIGAYNSMLVGFVPYAMQSFSRLYSKIHFHIYEKSYGDLYELLPQGSIDLAFMNSEVPKGFQFIPLFQDRAVVIMAENHPFVSYEKISPSVLNGCDFIMPVSGFDDIVAAVLEKSPFRPNIRYETASDAAVMAMVKCGMGVSIVSNLQCNILPSGVIYRELDKVYGRDLGIAIRSTKHASPAIREFIRTAQSTATQPDWQI